MLDRNLNPTAMRWIALGALLMLAGVILGAMGSHALQGSLTPRQLTSFQTGVLYQQLHALGLVLCGLAMIATPRTRWLDAACWLMLAGVVLFSGSIYLTTFGAPRGIGRVAPVGGTSFMLAWVCVAVHALRAGRA